VGTHALGQHLNGHMLLIVFVDAFVHLAKRPLPELLVHEHHEVLDALAFHPKDDQ
jgi:hypothetical protein